MRNFKLLTLLFFVVLTGISVNAKSSLENRTGEGKTIVYYFHNTRRCPTCLAIEKEAKKVLEDSFAEACEKGEIAFEAYNAEDSENKELVKKMNVTGSALIIVKNGDKYDLTSKGFMYALKQPEKFRKALWEILTD